MIKFISMLVSLAMSSVALSAPSEKSTGILTGLTAGQITFSVENMDLESDWYVRTFGMKVARKHSPLPDFDVQNLTMSGFAIDLVKQKGSKKMSYPSQRYSQQGYVHFAFYTDSIDSSLKVLKDLKTDVTPLKDDKGVTNRLIVHDPEGNELEIFLKPNY